MVGWQAIVKKTSLILGILSFLIGGYIFQVKSINLKNISNYLNAVIKEDTGVKITIENLSLNAFPSPQLKLHRISTDNGVFIDSAVVKLNLFSLFSDKYKISSIHINNLYTNPKKTRLDKISYHEAARKISSFNADIAKTTINKIWDTVVTNRILAENVSIKKNDKDVNLKLQLLNKIIFKDNIKFNKDSNNWLSKIEIANNNFNFKAQAIFNNSSVTSGEFQGDIKELNNFSKDISPYFDLIINKSIKSKESIKVYGKISHNDQYVLIDQINIKSTNIDANATYWIALNEENINTIQINLNKLNITNLTTGKDKNNSLYPDAIFKLDDSKLRIIVKANEIIVAEDNIKDFNLDSVGDGSQFKILACSGKINSGGEFVITGGINHNKFRPRFEGDINLVHNNVNNWLAKTDFASLACDSPSPLYFNSSIIATPIDFRVENFKMSIAGENITGNANLKLIGNETQLIGNINIEDLNLDSSNAPILKNIYQYLKSLTQEISKENYNSKFIPLRTFPLKSTMDLNLDNLIVENKLINRASIIISYDSGQFKVDDYLINTSKENYIRGNAKIIANSLKPSIEFNIHDGELTIDSFEKKKIDKFLNYAKMNFNFSGINLESEGNLRILNLGKIRLDNFSWEVSNADGILNISKIDFHSSEAGKGNITGSAIFSPFRLNLAYGIDSTNLNSFMEASNLSQLPFKEGLTSINGQLSTTGQSFDEILFNLYIKGDLLSKKVKVIGLDIPWLITQLSNSVLNKDVVSKLMNKAINFGSTDFSEIKGSYSLNNGILSLEDIIFLSSTFTGSAGVAINIYDNYMDLNTLFSFFPIGARIYDPQVITPIKLNLMAKGNIFQPDKLLQLPDASDINRIQILIHGPTYDTSTPIFRR